MSACTWTNQIRVQCAIDDWFTALGKHSACNSNTEHPLHHHVLLFDWSVS